jgi:hypothetical protein
MKATDDDLRAALAREGGRRGPGRAGCPPSEALARAAEAGPQRRPAELVDHLAGCADCAFEYRVASAFKPWAEGAAAALPGPSRTVSRPARLLPHALAASLVVCVGLGAWALTLRQQGGRLEARLADARRSLEDAQGRGPSSAPPLPAPEPPAGSVAGPGQPQANVALVDLFPRDSTRGGAAAAATVDPSRSPLVVLILNVRRPEPGATYAVEIADRRGAPVWAGEGIHADTEPVTLAIPSRLLTGDGYRIRLHRLRGGRRTLAEEYELRVQPAGSAPR